MNQELLETWMGEADEKYTLAVRDDNIALPRDTYVALYMEQRLKTYRIERERKMRCFELGRTEE